MVVPIRVQSQKAGKGWRSEIEVEAEIHQDSVQIYSRFKTKEVPKMAEKEKTLFERNVEMWEKFVNQNMDLMFKTMEKAMEGSQAVQEQVSKAVDKSLEGSQETQGKIAQVVNKALEGSQAFQEQVAKAVGAAVSAQAHATLAALKALERQVEAVSKKVDELLKTEENE
jgi:hypothetical protein